MQMSNCDARNANFKANARIVQNIRHTNKRLIRFFRIERCIPQRECRWKDGNYFNSHIPELRVNGARNVCVCIFFCASFLLCLLRSDFTCFLRHCCSWRRKWNCLLSVCCHSCFMWWREVFLCSPSRCKSQVQGGMSLCVYGASCRVDWGNYTSKAPPYNSTLFVPPTGLL